MPILVWGALAKSFDDPETIEEAIARMIDDHNDDVEAHLGENQAIEAHRTNEVIDHPAESIVADKILPGAIDFYQFDPLSLRAIINYESLDAFSNLLNASIYGFSVLKLNVGLTLNQKARARLHPGGTRLTLSDSLYSFYSTFFKRDESTDLDVRFGLGSLYDPWDIIEEIFAGFRYLNGSMYAYWVTYDSGLDQYDEHFEIISAPSFDSFHSYSVIRTPDDSMVRWYIDNELVHSEEIIWGASVSGVICTFVAKNGADNFNGAFFGTTTFIIK